LTYEVKPVPGVERGGRLIVRGPNVMLGYLKDDMPGAVQPPEGGRYDTCDIVSVDDEGYVTIQEQAKRFAKIDYASVQALVASER
jgi:acyl-[acyl-carrier-protein]-phospholipid O-acyltransferase/long-chain-fatty-acid--[acyl-carrier-protein] ligase